jgi:hypothetical protein
MGEHRIAAGGFVPVHRTPKRSSTRTRPYLARVSQAGHVGSAGSGALHRSRGVRLARAATRSNLQQIAAARDPPNADYINRKSPSIHWLAVAAPSLTMISISAPLLPAVFTWI